MVILGLASWPLAVDGQLHETLRRALDYRGKQPAMRIMQEGEFLDMAHLSRQKATLEQFWTSWIAFREFQGMKVYFTHLITYRCAIQKVRYGYNGGAADKVFKLPACDPADPHSVPYEAKVFMSVPAKTASMSVQLIYVDGSQSALRTFNAPK